MKVKNIILKACDFIENNDLKVPLESNATLTDAQQELADKLVRYFNYVQNEIATEYIPVIHREAVSAKDKLEFSSLAKTISEVIYIKDSQGKRISFRTFPDKIVFSGEISEITYSFIPEENTIGEDILFLVPERVYAYGIAREYYLFEGFTDKATLFEGRFKSSIQNLFKKGRNIVLPVREWL